MMDISEFAIRVFTDLLLGDHVIFKDGLNVRGLTSGRNDRVVEKVISRLAPEPSVSTASWIIIEQSCS